MSELQFPKNPIVGQQYDFPPYKYYWDGAKWKTMGIGYNPVNDLRDEVLPTTREALRRSYAEAGFNLVDGSFEDGGMLASASDVLLHKASGTAYSGPIGSVAAGTDPTLQGSGYVPRMDVVLRYDLLNGPLRQLLDGRFALRDVVSALDYTDDSDTITNGSLAVQKAIDSLGASGGMVIMPSAKYIWSAPVTTKSNVIIQGYGDSTEIEVATDIEVFNTDATITNATFRAELRDLFINKTFSGATTKYDVHFTNPNVCKCIRVRIKSGHDDNQYSATNVGGIFFDKPDGSTQSAFMNKVDDCWVQNNSVYFNNLTDSTITGGYVWGHVREFAIRMRNCGNVDVESISGIITSQYKGGIWIDGSANQIRITDNEWDGNPLLQRGDGIYCPQSAIAVTISGNTFWGCGKNGINHTDPIGWSVTGNTFWKNNDHDNGYDDIRLVGKIFSPQSNVYSGNTHVTDVSRINKGYAVREVNEGVNPANNIYQGNGVTGSSGYLSPAFKIQQQAEICGNFGLGTEELSNHIGMRHTFGVESAGLQIAYASSVAASGYIDIPINTDDYIGNPGGFSGQLFVTSCRENFASQSSRYIYAAMAYGTTGVFTEQAVQNGVNGGRSVSITMPSNGVIRVTNTSPDTCRIRVAFNGVKSLS